MVKKREKGRQGLASMTKEDRQRIASLGGKAAHANGTAHQFTKEEAAIAGSKGGVTTHKKNRKARKQTTKTGRKNSREE